MNRPSWLNDSLACALLIFIGYIALWPTFFCGRALYWGDISLYFAPMQTFLAENLHNGNIPLWNPMILCGQPFVGNPQTWPLYPMTALSDLLPPFAFLTIVSGIHLILGGIFYYAFARGTGLDYVGALFSGTVFMLGGFFVSKAQFPNMTAAIAYVPLVMFLAGRFINKQNLSTSVALGLVFGLQLLAAHAQISLMTIYLCLAYALFIGSPLIRAKSFSYGKFFGYSAIAALLSICVAAGQLLPTVELWRHSDRQILTISDASRFILSPGQLTNFFMPRRFGSPITSDYHVRGNFWECACYLGVTPCLLLVYAWFFGIRTERRTIRFWSILFILGICLALGRHFGLYYLAFYLIPGVKAFHDPARFLLLAAISGSLLSGYGLSWLLQRSQDSKIVLTALLFIFTIGDLAFQANSVYPTKSLEEINFAINKVKNEQSLHNVGNQRILSVGSDLAWHDLIQYKDFQQMEPTYLYRLYDSHTPNVNMLLNLNDASGYEPEPVSRSVTRLSNAEIAFNHGDFTKIKELGIVGLVRYAKTSPLTRTVYYYSLANAAESLSQRARITGSNQALYVQDINPDLVTLNLPRVDLESHLVLVDTMMPGWFAKMDGQSVPIEVTPEGFRFVKITPSDRVKMLVFQYRPTSWLLGLYLSLTGLMCVCITAAHQVSCRVILRKTHNL